MDGTKTARLRLAGPLDTPTRYASGLLCRLRTYDAGLRVFLETAGGELVALPAATNRDLQTVLAVFPGHAEVVFEDEDGRSLVVTGETGIPAGVPDELRVAVRPL